MKKIVLPLMLIAVVLSSSFIVKEAWTKTTTDISEKVRAEILDNPLPQHELAAKFSEASSAGLYICTTYWKNAEDKVFASPHIDGVFQRSFWKTFEPEQGKYDWTYMDEAFDAAIKHKKKISLGIAAGSGQPDWIYKTDIPFLNFVEIPMEGKSKYVNELRLPVFWNPKYIQYWTGFVAAVANHLKEKPEYWNTLSMIKVTGFNRWNSDEFRMPAQREVSNAKARSTDAIKIWTDNGYRPSLVINAFKQVIDTFGKYFPDKSLCLPVIAGGRGFPHIGEDGKEILNTKEDGVTQPIMDYMTTKFGKRFMAMYEALQDKPTDGSVSFLVTKQHKKGSAIGYQLCQQCYKFPPCLKDKTPCDNEAFYKVFENGMAQGALYFELYESNIKAYPGALKKAQEKIKKQSKELN